MTELELLKSGDTAYIEKIYDESFKSILSWVKKNSGTAREAEDLFQDAVVAVYQKSKDEEFKLNCKLSTFIFGVAKKMWLHILRTRGRYFITDFTTIDTPSLVDESLVDNVLIEKEMNALYKSKFETLTEECRKILSLFFTGKSMMEVMHSMGLQTEGITRKRKFRCKEKLVKAIEKDPRYAEIVER